MGGARQAHRKTFAAPGREHRQAPAAELQQKRTSIASGVRRLDQHRACLLPLQLSCDVLVLHYKTAGDG